MRPIAFFLVALAACGCAWAQAPADASEAAAEARARDAATRPVAKPLRVTWQAPDGLRQLYEKFLPPPAFETGERRGVSLRAWVRDVRRRVPEIAASEGYFSPTFEITFTDETREHAVVRVTPGPRATVGTIDIRFEGDVAGDGAEREARRKAITQAWTMQSGQPFRSADWEVAKTRLQESLTDRDYAAGAIASSAARVDAEAARANLELVLDSGPRFTMGDVFIEGLEHYPEAVVRRMVDLERGERYSRDRLTDLQRAIQAGPWFSSVVADIDHDPGKPDLVPVHITVTERPRREVGLAVGYGTDDGFRVETAFRDRNLFARGLDLQSSIRAGQEQQIGYVDVYLPPGLMPWRGRNLPFTDSVGVLAEHSTVQKLVTSRFAVAGYRHFRLEKVETRVGLSYQVERAYPEGSDPRIKRALAPIVQATWRNVDNLYDPRRGGVLNVQFATGARALASGEDFLKAYGQYQRWVPVGARDQVLLRMELGRTFAASREHLPEDFLFRAGGARSNRGYAYQSLGAREGEAVVGGRYIATASAEYVHWLNDRWGAAVFTDVGDAADSATDLRLNPSYGVGARFKTPAGPLALDLAYAERDAKFRISFSVTVAF